MGECTVRTRYAPVTLALAVSSFTRARGAPYEIISPR